jgi:hypothetical protein
VLYWPDHKVADGACTAQQVFDSGARRHPKSGMRVDESYAIGQDDARFSKATQGPSFSMLQELARDGFAMVSR